MLSLVALTIIAAPQLEDSVVKIIGYSARHDMQAPWRLTGVRSGSGTGFLIEGDRIVTNAHVVADAKQLLVKRHDRAVPFVAQLEAVADDCDLAILRVSDSKFREGLSPLRLGRLPKRRSKVTTYGYPAGGQELSSTTGIISRIEWLTYVHTESDSHMAVQTDAAINPGNSGGPVIQNGKVVGVAFQGASNLDNVGFFIPVPVLQHFLTNIKDGRYDGFPDSGARTTDLVSEAYRRERNLPDGETGVVVEAIAPGGTMDGVLQSGDVILAVDGIDVDNDGSIPIGDIRGPYHHLVDMKQVGQPLKIDVWRNGKRQTVVATARRIARFDRYRNRYGDPPRYLFFAGMLFLPLDREYMRTFGQRWPGAAPKDLSWVYFFKEWEKPGHADEEAVVLAKVYQHPVNAQLALGRGRLMKVNGQPIHGLTKLDEVLNVALQKGEGTLIFEYSGGYLEALDIKEAAQAHPEILKTYGVRLDKRL